MIPTTSYLSNQIQLGLKKDPHKEIDTISVKKHNYNPVKLDKK